MGPGAQLTGADYPWAHLKAGPLVSSPPVPVAICFQSFSPNSGFGATAPSEPPFFPQRPQPLFSSRPRPETPYIWVCGQRVGEAKKAGRETAGSSGEGQGGPRDRVRACRKPPRETGAFVQVPIPESAHSDLPSTFSKALPRPDLKIILSSGCPHSVPGGPSMCAGCKCVPILCVSPSRVLSQPRDGFGGHRDRG